MPTRASSQASAFFPASRPGAVPGTPSCVLCGSVNQNKCDGFGDDDDDEDDDENHDDDDDDEHGEHDEHDEHNQHDEHDE